MTACSIKDCVRAAASKGLCPSHYLRNMRYGSPDGYDRVWKIKSKCSFNECDRDTHAKTLCHTHYAKLLRTGNLDYQPRFQGDVNERNRARTAKWKKDNWDYYRSYLLNRKKRVRVATPRWVDRKEITEFYRGCPKGYHVDHVIPVNGEDVSGLHVLWNLQYLPAKENLSKGRKLIRGGLSNV